MNLDGYDDMMGLEFGDYEGLEAFLSPQMIREALMAGSAGGGAILLTSWAVKKINENVDFLNNIENPLLKAAVTSSMAFFAGLAGGRALYEYNRTAAMGIVGGVGGVAMAHLIDVAIAQFTDSEPMGITLGEADEYGPSFHGEGMSELAALDALGTTGVTTAPGAFSGLADPSVTPEALMGLDGTVVQQETLGEMGAYAPYLS